MSGKRYFTEDPTLRNRYHFPSGLVVDVFDGSLLLSGEPAELRALTMDDARGLGLLAAKHSPTMRVGVRG